MSPKAHPFLQIEGQLAALRATLGLAFSGVEVLCRGATLHSPRCLPETDYAEAASRPGSAPAGFAPDDGLRKGRTSA